MISPLFFLGGGSFLKVYKDISPVIYLQNLNSYKFSTKKGMVGGFVLRCKDNHAQQNNVLYAFEHAFKLTPSIGDFCNFFSLGKQIFYCFEYCHIHCFELTKKQVYNSRIFCLDYAGAIKVMIKITQIIARKEILISSNRDV